MASVRGAAGASSMSSTFAGITASTTPEGMGLWLLVLLELAAQVGLRHYFRRHHGG